MKRFLESRAIRASLVVAVIAVTFQGCSAILPVVEDALRVICRVGPHNRDGGLVVSIQRIFPDGATQEIDATVIENH